MRRGAGPGLPSLTGRAQAISDSGSVPVRGCGDRPDVSSQPSRASPSVVSSTAASFQSGSMPGGRASCASGSAQFFASAGPPSRWPAGPRQPPSLRS